jgi:hypothetical protein
VKLRIKGDTLRLRLARAEVERLTAGSEVEETTHLAPGTALRYTVRPTDRDGLGATWDEGALTVLIPAAWLPGWPDDDRVGFEGRQDAGDGKTLELLVEKDFACLHKRPDEPDAFPNPLAADAGA